MSAVLKHRAWTPEQRLEQSRKLRERKIWLVSTGPRTSSGKKTSSQNSLKHGGRSAAAQRFRTLCRLLDSFRRNYKLIMSGRMKLTNELIGSMLVQHRIWLEEAEKVADQLMQTIESAIEQDRQRVKLRLVVNN